MRLLLAFSAITFAFAAQADPSYHRVTGVAADDALNVRAEPSGSSEDIGDLPYDAKGIEVVRTDDSGDWGRIIWAEANGWIAMRYLEIDPQPLIGTTKLPQGLLCAGTEPFWSLRLPGGGATYAGMAEDALVLTMTGALTPQARGPFPVVLSHGGPTAATMSFIEPMQCSDGMSDRKYP